MSDSKHPIPDDELISAYHDGELRGDDLARAERLLAEQPEARQLLEDLRSLSSTLGSTPRQSLGDDFPQRVLRQAEREMLEAAPVKSPAASARSKPSRSSKVKAPAPTKSRTAPLPRWPQGSRPWIYVAVATAAAIVLMLNRPDDGPNVAVLGDNAARELNEVGEMAAAPAGRPGLPPLMRKGVVDENVSHDFMRRENDAAPQPTPPLGGERMLSKTGEGPMPKGGFSPADGLADRAKVAQQNEYGRQAVLRSLTSLGLDVSPKEVESQVRQTEQTLDDLPIEAGVVVIYCDVNRNAWNQNGLVTVERSFNDNGIATEQEAIADATRFKQQQGLQQEGLSVANTMVGGAGGNRMAVADPVETFYVVATPPQLAATLDKLESCKDVVVNVNVETAPDASGLSAAYMEAENEPLLSSYSGRGLEPARWALQQQTQQRETLSRSQKPRSDVESKAVPKVAEPQAPAAPAPAEPEARDMRRNSGVAGGVASSATPSRNDSSTDADKRPQSKVVDAKKLDQETPADSQVPAGGKAKLAEKVNEMQRPSGGVGGGAVAPAKSVAPVSGLPAMDGAVSQGAFGQTPMEQSRQATLPADNAYRAPTFGRAQRLFMQQSQAELPQARGEQAVPASPANVPQAAAKPATSQPVTTQPIPPQPAPAAESAPRQSMAKDGYAPKPEPKPGEAPASAPNPAPAITAPAPVAAPVTVKQLDDANLQQLTPQPTAQMGSSYGNDATATKLQRAILIFRCVEPSTADSKVPTAPID